MHSYRKKTTYAFSIMSTYGLVRLLPNVWPEWQNLKRLEVPPPFCLIFLHKWLPSSDRLRSGGSSEVRAAAGLQELQVCPHLQSLICPRLWCRWRLLRPLRWERLPERAGRKRSKWSRRWRDHQRDSTDQDLLPGFILALYLFSQVTLGNLQVLPDFPAVLEQWEVAILDTNQLKDGNKT